jgi:osmoprotectant transport system ATP-binding protein
MLRLEGVTKRFGPQAGLEPTTLDFPAGATTAVIGPSGCGKSTLLRLLIGLVVPDAGRVLVEGAVLEPGSAQRLRRRMGYVIQEGGLFPHLTAGENVSLLARQLGRAAGEIAARMAELAELVQLERALLARHPLELSGGERQRVGLMRALMLDPSILLLDEPLGALDPVTRGELQEQLKRIFARLGKTVVLVTHDLGEAAYLGEEIVLMRAGRVLQRGPFAELLARPAEPFVAEFIRVQRKPW